MPALLADAAKLQRDLQTVTLLAGCLEVVLVVCCKGVCSHKWWDAAKPYRGQRAVVHLDRMVPSHIEGKFPGKLVAVLVMEKPARAIHE
eukprot:scaffold63077_cov26-Tisochrysis_lutea.AAC.1